MGSRANYVITDRGRHEVWYSHWGAQRIGRDFFFGPDVALELIWSLRPIDHLLDTAWAEGGVIMDVDQQKLRLWGGEDLLYDVRLRNLWLEMLAISWKGWDVGWARHGMIDIADHMGVPRPSVRPANSTGRPIRLCSQRRGPWVPCSRCEGPACHCRTCRCRDVQSITSPPVRNCSIG